MKFKSCLLVSLVLLAGCNMDVTTSKNVSSSDEKSTSSVKPFDDTPYSYEPATITLPEDGEVDGRDWIGRCINMTADKELFIDTDCILRNDFFDRDWKYNDVLTKSGTPAYASEDHKPVLEFDSVLLSDVNQLPATYHLKNTNFDVPTGFYKEYLFKRTHFNSSDYNSTLVYHTRANAIYYNESFPSFETYKEECSSHIYIHTMNAIKKACETNTKEAYADLFKTRGTHIIWSVSYGMGTELLYEVNSNDYDLSKLANSEFKEQLDAVVLADVNSKTVGELEEKNSFTINKYLNVEEGKYVFEGGISGSLYGGKAAFPPMSLDRFSKTVKNLMTTSVEDVKQSAFLNTNEVYPIWEFLPSSMAEEKVLLENAYKVYASDRAAYYESQYQA